MRVCVRLWILRIIHEMNKLVRERELYHCIIYIFMCVSSWKKHIRRSTYAFRIFQSSRNRTTATPTMQYEIKQIRPPNYKKNERAYICSTIEYIRITLAPRCCSFYCCVFGVVVVLANTMDCNEHCSTYIPTRNGQGENTSLL